MTDSKGEGPRIPDGHGDAPVQVYIEAMPGWMSDVGRRLDALIERTVSNVEKAERSYPVYGLKRQGFGGSPDRGLSGSDIDWFLGSYCQAKRAA